MNTYSNKIDGSKKIKALGIDILFSEGIDISLINIKEDGIAISSFKKLCTQIYDTGYRAGLDKHKVIGKIRQRMEKEGKYLQMHANIAKDFKEKSQINKLK